jgi:arylsulfatase A-like enzyme
MKRRICAATSSLVLCTVLSFVLMPVCPSQQDAHAAEAPDYQVKPPSAAPNVVVVLLDDVGFGASSTFGGPIQTPALEALARDGLRYNRFHTTAICSPTRASLLTGRNPHNTGIGAVENTADERVGYSGFHTKDTASIATILREHGYSTSAYGKWHQVADWETSPSGPFDRWPTGEGFEHFYGFIGGETDQFDPSLYDGTTPVMRPAGRDYHLTEDLAANAIAWMRAQHSVTPDKPIFLYFAPGGTHAPLQAPRAWIDQYRGKFDQGWDKMREETFARQKQLGVIPADTKLTPRDSRMPAWDSLTADQKRVAARLMEVYAGYLAHTDAQVGKLIDALKADGKFDNTLIFYVFGDNGASGEGGLFGSASYFAPMEGLAETDAIRLANIVKLGGPESYPHYPAEWAWAMDTPFQWMKTVASHLGGTRNAMVVDWPGHILDHGGLRTQFGHVNDITPTILEAAHIDAPKVIDGVPQKPIDGTSLLYSFADAKAPERHSTQYFEVFGHRAIYHDGWMASAFHSRLPWSGIDFSNKKFDDDKWELYNLDKDFSQADDLATQQPVKLAELKALFTSEAERNQVLPLRNTALPGANGLPTLSAGRTSVSYHEGAIGIPESALPRTYNRSWSVSATVDLSRDARGVIATLGGSSAGWSLYLDPNQMPLFTYRLFDIKTVTLKGPKQLTPGRHELRFDFDYDGGGYGKGGKIRLLVDGVTVGEDHLPGSPTSFYTIDESFDVGLDHGSPAGFYPADAEPGYRFQGGHIEVVTVTVGADGNISSQKR